MTSLATRKLHSLVPRMLRARGTNRKGIVGQGKTLSPMLLRGDVAKMVVGGQRWYNAAVAQVEEEQKDDGGWEKNIVKDKMDRQLYKLDMVVRKSGRVIFAELDKIVKIIQQSGQCTSSQALFVIRCCGDVLVDLSPENRTKILERYSDIIQKSGVTFDVSHYNAILKVHIENLNFVTAADFLGQMEAAGITPNRVTFQHLVSIYCLEKNIAAATTILEHMKAEGMGINESVFISLLKGHCANNDSDSVSATLEVMASSGLSLGAETYTAMATSYGLSSNWAKVEETMKKAADEDVKLDDGDVFSIILACSRGGLFKESESLVAMLPKKRGFFEEMRNHIPQVAMSGNLKSAVEIYISLDNKEGNDRTGHGMFVVGAVVRSGSSVEEVLEAVKKMEDAGYHSSIQFLIHEAAYHWTKEKFEELVEIIKKEKDGEELNLEKDLVFRFLRGTFNQNLDVEKMLVCINNLYYSGSFVPNAFISNDLMDQMINLDVDLPGRTAAIVKEKCPFLPMKTITNMVFTNLFNRETVEHLHAATGYMLNISFGVINPISWNYSLARTYLLNDSLDDLITIMFMSSQGQEKETQQHIFHVLKHIASLTRDVKPDSTVEQVLSPVLQELVRLHIGVPSDVVNILSTHMISEEGKGLLVQSEQSWNRREEFWTADTRAACLEERKKLFGDSNLTMKRHGFFQVPRGRKEMEKIQNILAGKGKVNYNLSDKLIRAYLDDGMLEQAIELINYSKLNGDFHLSVNTFDILISKIVEQGRWKEAMDMVDQQMLDRKLYLTTFSTALVGMALAGEHEAVLERIANVDKSKLDLSDKGGDFSQLLSFYNRDSKMVEEVSNLFACLEERKKLIGDSFSTKKRNYSKEIFQVPQDRKEMEKIQNNLAGRGKVNYILSDKLIRAYLDDGMIEQAIELISYSKQNGDFDLSVTNFDLLISKIVEQGKWKEAMDMVDQQMLGNKLYLSTLSTALVGMASAGEHKAVLDRIANVDKSKLVFSDKGGNFSQLLSFYTSNGDSKMLEEVFNLLAEKNLLKIGSRNLGYLVQVHLVNNDLRAAVAEVERIARQYKCMPKSFALTNRLIAEESVDDLQTMLDTSIVLHGPERPLYDLAFSYLVMDKRAKAQKLLETPGLKYDREKLEYIIDNLIESGNLNALDDLVKLTKGLFGCDRDFLYHKLVSANKDNVDKIEDIWLQVQEEGHAPTDSLLIAIAEALKLGGKEVPFQVPVEYVPVVATEKPTMEKMQTKKTGNQTDDDIYTALTVQDFNAAEEIVTANWHNVSLKCKRKVLDTLTENDRLEEACRVATRLANSFEDPRKIQFRECYHELCTKLDEKKSSEFLEGLKPEFRVRLDQQKLDTKKERQNLLFKSQEEGAGNDEAVAAMATDDISGLVQIFQKANISISCRNKLLEKLVKEDKLEDAASVALAACAYYKESKLNTDTIRLICILFEKWEASGQVMKTKEFRDKHNPVVGSTLKCNIWVKAGLIRTDPSAYIELVNSEDDLNKWVVTSDVLEEAVGKHPDLLERLEAMDDVTKSSVLLGKWSMLKGDKVSLEKYVKLCPKEMLNQKYSGLFDKIDTIEKLVLALDVLKKIDADKKALEQVANNCLSRNVENDQFMDIANLAVDNGVQVESFTNQALRKLENANEFKFQSKAKETLAARKTRKS